MAEAESIDEVLQRIAEDATLPEGVREAIRSGLRQGPTVSVERLCQPLTVIIGHLDLAVEAMSDIAPDPDVVEHDVRQALEAAREMAAMVACARRQFRRRKGVVS